MAQVLVRELDPDVLERLKVRARRNHRSLEAELRFILREASEPAATCTPEVERVRALFAGRAMSDSAELQHEDREAGADRHDEERSR